MEGDGRAGRWSRRVGLLGAGLAALLALTPLMERAELRTQDLRFRLRGPRSTRAKIVIAAVTASTLDAWREPLVTWGRHYADAIRRARTFGARWIGLDVIPAVSGGKDSDRALALALAGGRVVLANARPPGQEPINPIEALLFARPEQPEEIG